jgi:Dihydroprymidine dehydrogenase domain II, 4Fe-4S cluster/Thiamine pyrophosphate enzyme, C-terminal TPP binding domain
MAVMPLASDEVYEALSPPLTSDEAVVEADRCLDCGGPYAPAPCTTACPAGVDVPRFVTAIADGRPDDAAATIFAENMLGGTCARVCPVELLCEGACVLTREGRRPIEVGRLQRFATDHALAADLHRRTCPGRSRAHVSRPARRPVSRLKALAAREAGTPPLRGGHSLCQGCGIPMVVRTIVDSIDTPVVVVSATGCLEVATTRFPTTAWNVPWLHVAFENAAAVASGVETAYRALPKRAALPQDGPATFVALAGDGGTYDIGLQALSGALERGHRLIFVCYDNEAYMNTGVQRSGATPFGASTTTSPVGCASLGKAQQRKDTWRRQHPRTGTT